jgi:hypothetical protein
MSTTSTEEKQTVEVVRRGMNQLRNPLQRRIRWYQH